MEEAIRTRFNDRILEEARQRYGIAADKITLLDSFESFMFAFQKDGQEFILRLCPSRSRSPELIHAEVDWINYLAAGGAGVAQAVLSENEELVEAIADDQGGHFLATAFVKAPGGPPQKALWSEQLFVPYGRLLGRIHRLSKQYQPSNPAWRRPSWHDPMMQYAHLYLAKEQTAVHTHYQELMTYLCGLPQDPDSYGLIHQDAHGGNFFVDENYNITLFDFDDCVYGHFAYDLAMVVFYAVTNEPDPVATAATLWPAFMRGYHQENTLDPAWLAEIPHFMTLREIDLYAVLLHTFGPGPSGSTWVDTFMHGRQARIADRLPYVNFDFRDTTL